jgi:hypothetical protein
MRSLVDRLIPATSTGAAKPLLVIKPPANGIDLQVSISGLSLETKSRYHSRVEGINALV